MAEPGSKLPGSKSVRVVVCKNRAKVLKIKKLNFFQNLPERRYERS